jgi:hypothetical protein
MMHTFATWGPVTATVNIPAGSIQVTAAGPGTATVEIRPADPSKSRDVKLAAQTTAGYSGGILAIAGPAGNRVLGSTGAVEVTVELPAGSRVEARAASAELTTAGQLGDVVFDSSQATVQIDHAATARVTTVDGDVTVGRLDGDAEIRTVKGDIQVTEATGGTLTLRAQAGSITAGAASGVPATLDAGTTVGRISNALVNTGGAGGLTIHATTTVGDITARSL